VKALPRVARFFFLTERWLQRLNHLHNIFRDEALWATTNPEERGRINAFIYSQSAPYFPGGTYFEMGLFSWEQRAVALPAFPRQGCILLGAAGAGREMAALSKMGYEVLAFEPNEQFAEVAKKVAESLSSCETLSASYEDLIDAVQSNMGPLVVVRGRRFDAVVLGWGSFSYVMGQDRQRALLSSLRRAAPSAPVLLSFPPSRAEAKLDRLRPILRRVFRLMRASAPGAGDVFDSKAGFIHVFSEAEIQKLAAEAGYEVAFADFTFYPHVLLKPASGTPS
jgi:hypothetical protein